MCKLVNKIIVSRNIFLKWERTDDGDCPICKVRETVEHIYFSCPRIQLIWTNVGRIMKTRITWKKLILGFFYADNIHTKTLNLLLTIVMYTIHNAWFISFENILIRIS